MAFRPGVVAAFVVFVSGCVAHASNDLGPAATTTDAAPAASPAEFDASTGGVDGLVHDEELRPVGDANVSVADLGLGAITDGDGRFTFSHVPPGTFELSVEKEGYGGSSLFVQVVTGASTRTTILLTVDAVAEPFYKTQIQKGVLGCSVDTSPGGGLSGCDAWEPYLDLSQYIPEDYNLHWKLEAKPSQWRGSTFEMAWQSTQTLSRSLMMMWDISTCAFGSESESLGGAHGRTPLHAFVNSSGIQAYREAKNRPCKDVAKVCNDEVGCKIESMVFGDPDFLGPSSPVDATVVWQQPFTQYLTDFYFHEGSPDFRAIPDS